MEYKDRVAAIAQQEAQVNEDGSPVFTRVEIDQKKAELKDWAQTFRWQVDWKGKQEKELWPILRVIRGCCNTQWRLEQDCIRNKEPMPAEAIADIDSHFANMISCLGRICYRSWADMQSICPYLLEDEVEDEKQASGGSGKSLMINLVVGSGVKFTVIGNEPPVSALPFTYLVIASSNADASICSGSIVIPPILLSISYL